MTPIACTSSSPNTARSGGRAPTTRFYGRGVLRAIDYQTGAVRWSHDLHGGAGARRCAHDRERPDLHRRFGKSALALRSSDGATLWHTGIGRVNNSPITYELDGRQYVLFGGGSALYAFALP